MKTIVLKLSPPLQSWGTVSHTETRNTDMYPSKSAIIGLISAALGYRRNDNRILNLNNLLFAVRIDQQGLLNKDFQIAKKYKSNGEFEKNYVTNRYFIEDAVYTVFLSSEDDQLINSIQSALTKPYFQLYAGRRSYVLNADYYQGVYTGKISQIISNFPWLARDEYKKKQSGHTLQVFADAQINRSILLTTSRQDKLISADLNNRRHGQRLEIEFSIRIQEEMTEKIDHDPFSFWRR